MKDKDIADEINVTQQALATWGELCQGLVQALAALQLQLDEDVEEKIVMVDGRPVVRIEIPMSKNGKIVIELHLQDGQWALKGTSNN